MTTNRPNYFVITGGPGAGKTTIIDALRARGFRTVDEVGRQIIRAQVAIGGNALHWGDREAFAELMLSHSIYDFERLGDDPAPVFFDHGIPDLTGYFRLIGVPVPAHVRKATRLFRCNPVVFVAPPWREIYVNDPERKQDFAEAVATWEACVAASVEAGYQLVELPKAWVAERVAFVLDRVETWTKEPAR